MAAGDDETGHAVDAETMRAKVLGMHRIGLRVVEHCPAIGGSREAQTAALRMAVRAVLLHGAATGPLRVDTEPTAHMLAVCNELLL